jgi:hypothetical protein
MIGSMDSLLPVELSDAVDGLLARLGESVRQQVSDIPSRGWVPCSYVQRRNLALSLGLTANLELRYSSRAASTRLWLQISRACMSIELHKSSQCL